MFEYKVIPAPRKALRRKGANGTTERFAVGLQDALNEFGAEGWSYVRAETLPVDERHGLLRKAVEEFHTVLIFRRPLTPQHQNEAAEEHRRPKFFAEKTPPAASAPALGPAADSEMTATAEIRAEKQPEGAKAAKPAKKNAAKKRSKTAE